MAPSEQDRRYRLKRLATLAIFRAQVPDASPVLRRGPGEIEEIRIGAG
ncbi:MAG: hypothetical protein AAF456_17285 [Planctomycetota bacterium]